MRPLVFETEGVRFCDVDQPAVLAFKGKVLESHGVTPCVGIPCNYLEVDLPAKLEEAGLDLDAPILFIWEGNTMYLPEELIYGFLGRLTGRIRSFKIAFDFFARSVIDRTTGDEHITATTDAFENTLKVKWLTGFDDLSVVRERTGLKVAESGSLFEFGKRVAPDVPDEIPELHLYLYGIMTPEAA